MCEVLLVERRGHLCECVCAEASGKKYQYVHDSWRKGPGGTSCQEPHSVGGF